MIEKTIHQRRTDMKARIILLTFCLLLLNPLQAKENAALQAADNLGVTRQHYSQLISGNVPNIAELTLFTNMLPKGGDIHHHYSGAVYAETFLDWVGAQNYCIYRVDNPVLNIKKYQIETKPGQQKTGANSDCISAEMVRNDNDFYRGLLKRWSDKDYGNHYHEQPAPDQQFFGTFGYFWPVATYKFNDGLKILKARAKAENIGYLETMLIHTPSVKNAALDDLNKLNPDSTPKQIESALNKAYKFLSKDSETESNVSQFVKTLEEAAKGIDDENFKLRFQTYVTRNDSPSVTFSGLYSAFASTLRTPYLVGVNIVGPENGYVATRDYSLHMKMFAFLKKRFPNAKVSLHSGELVLGMVPPEDLKFHIREAVLVGGASRIGHGIDIAHETDAYKLLEIMKGRKIAVEINLTSNAFILGVKDEAHPVLLYSRYGVPFVISTDDAGVSRNNLSNEYLLYTSRYKPSYDTLKKVVYNSITYSFLSEAEKLEEKTRLDKRFAEFEARIAVMAKAAK